MPKIRTTALAAITLAAATLDDRAPAQDVILSEIAVDSGGTWIELFNRGPTVADVSNWALYLATSTPGQPHTYWWGFRPGSTIAAGGYLIVRWLAPVPTVPTPGEIATGDSYLYFLFGLGAEPMPLQQGALALLRSQQNSQMNSSSVFVDWVGWGGGGLPREDLAEQAGVWVQGHATPPLAFGSSLARHPAGGSATHPEQAWFVDSTPTPGADNVGAAALEMLGTPCAPAGHHLLGTPALEADSLPVLGNAGFAFAITNTTGVLLETCVLALAADTVSPGLSGLLPPAPGDASCRVLIDPGTCFGSIWIRTSLSHTHVPLGLDQAPAALAGARFAAQALVFDLSATAWPPYQGLTNAVVVTLGN